MDEISQLVELLTGPNSPSLTDPGLSEEGLLEYLRQNYTRSVDLGGEAKTITPRMLRIGSEEARQQQGPTCSSHAIASAIRGAIKWRNDKYNPRRIVEELSPREAKIREEQKNMPTGPNSKVVMIQPDFEQLQPALNSKIKKIQNEFCRRKGSIPFFKSIDMDIILFPKILKTLDKYFAISVSGPLTIEELIQELDNRPEETGTQLVLNMIIYRKVDIKGFELFLRSNFLEQNGLDETTVFGPHSEISYTFGSETLGEERTQSYKIFPSMDLPDIQLVRRYVTTPPEVTATEYQHTNHLMYISGYGKKDGKYYLEIKNSWGTEWGFNGKIRASIDLFKDVGKKPSELWKTAPYRTVFKIYKLKPNLDTRLAKSPQALQETLELRGGKNRR